MYLAFIDHISNNGTSVFHKAKPISKIVLSICLLAIVIGTNNLLKLICISAIIMTLFFLAGIPIKRIWHLVLYPAFFSLIYALVKALNSWDQGAVVVLKAIDAALSMLFLFCTTPYAHIMSFFSLFMPPLLVDIFIFTYRAFFILTDQISNLLMSIKLKGGYHFTKLFTNMKNMGNTIGVLILHSFEMSERMYKIYALRGYNGHIVISTDKWWPLTVIDWCIFVLAFIIIVGMVIPWSL